jgi:acyl carrier protein
MTAPMTLAEFQAHMASQLEVEPAFLATEADLRTELGLDSIQLLVLLMALEDLGVELPGALLPHILTLSDAHAYYVNHQGHQP